MATTESTWTFERISDFDRDGPLDLWRTLPAPDPVAMEGEVSPWTPPYFAAAFRGFLTVADPATGRTRHEVFGLHGPTGPWVGVDDSSAEAR